MGESDPTFGEPTMRTRSSIRDCLRHAYRLLILGEAPPIRVDDRPPTAAQVEYQRQLKHAKLNPDFAALTEAIGSRVPEPVRALYIDHELRFETPIYFRFADGYASIQYVEPLVNVDKLLRRSTGGIFLRFGVDEDGEPWFVQLDAPDGSCPLYVEDALESVGCTLEQLFKRSATLYSTDSLVIVNSPPYRATLLRRLLV